MRERRSLAPPQLMDQLYRRKLPHWRTEGATYFVTWRLASEQSRLAPPERDYGQIAIKVIDDRGNELNGSEGFERIVGQASLPVDDARASFARATSHEPDAYGRTSPSTELCAMRASWSRNSITSSATRGGVGPPWTAIRGSGPATKVGSRVARSQLRAASTGRDACPTISSTTEGRFRFA